MTDKSQLDEQIFKLLINCEEYSLCDMIFAYVSTQIEVGTRSIIAHALENGKKVAVPKCDTQFCTMQFYQINSLDDLTLGAYDILEPDVQRCEQVSSTKNSICLVPGLSFDKRGYRLGFGKGYYDRFLPSFKGKAIGLCYENCISDELIINEFDRKVSVLITENKIINFQSEENDHG